MNPVDPKDPDEDKWYVMDWADGLNADATILTSDWTVVDPAQSTPVTVSDDEIVAGGLSTRVLFSGGVAGSRITVTNEVVTSDGETLQRSAKLRVSQR